jgi:hypothetical protein
MKKAIILALLLCAFPVLTTSAEDKDDFTLSLTLTTGEHSRDSNAETTTIRLNGNNLTYEKTYSGYGASRRDPVRREFKLKASEIAQLKSLVKAKNLLGSGGLNFKPAAGQSTYFELTIHVTLKGITGTQELTGPRDAANIKEERVYQKSLGLLEELFRIINLRDKELTYTVPVN